MMFCVFGVGLKLVGCIVSELKDKVGKLVIEVLMKVVVVVGMEILDDGIGKTSAEAVSALVNLGYG